MKMYVLIFIFFSLLYIAFEVCFYAITFSKINQLLKKKKWSLFGFTSLWMFPFGGIAGFIISFFYNVPFIYENVSIFPFVMLFGMIIITTLELGAGYLLNIKLKLNIWHYDTAIKLFGKTIPMNFLGQIDIYHSLGWFFMTYLVCILDKLLRYLMR